MKNSQFIWTSYLMSFEVIFFIIRTETVPFACSLCGVPACAGVQSFTIVCVVCVIANKPIQNIYLLFCLLFSFRISRTVCVACTIKLPFFIFSKLKTFFFVKYWCKSFSNTISQRSYTIEQCVCLLQCSRAHIWFIYYMGKR